MQLQAVFFDYRAAFYPAVDERFSEMNASKGGHGCSVTLLFLDFRIKLLKSAEKWYIISYDYKIIKLL